MAGSSIGAMVVGTVFIMVFGMATVTMVESIDESVKNSEFELSEPEVILLSVTDKVETTGPVLTVSIGTTAGTGSGASVNIIVTAGEIVGFGLNLVPGNGYSIGEIVTINCGSSPNSGDYSVSSIEDQNTVTVLNSGSETVDLSHIFLTLSDTGTKAQGTPFTPFVNHYSGSNLYLFPGEQLTSDAFALDPTTHGFAIGDDPDRAFLAIYDHKDAKTVTVT